MDKFIRIAITGQNISENEAENISSLLISGMADLVHLRHPEADIEDVRTLIAKIPENLHPRLTLHDFFELTDEFNIGGIHYNSRNPLPSPGAFHTDIKRLDGKAPLRQSISCHSINELLDLDNFGRSFADRYYTGQDSTIQHSEGQYPYGQFYPYYATLSPIFDSISKQGYKAAFNFDELQSALSKLKLPVIALGGVTPEKIPLLTTLGFKGAAMLGHYHL